MSDNGVPLGSLFAGSSILIIFMLSAPIYREAAAAGTAPAGASIGASFEEFWTAAHGRGFPQQKILWNAIIERPRQALYTTVVWETRDRPDWNERKDRLLQQRFLEYSQVSARIAPAARALQADIPLQAARFRALFPDAPSRPSVQIVLAPNFDAKSGLLDNGTPVLVFAVDSLVLEHADLRVVFPHELFHLYHALHAGIQNDGVMPRADLTLPLFAEGLATYVSSRLSPGHSDGQLLLQDDLGALPTASLPAVATRFLADADAQAVDAQHPQPFARWFMSAHQAYQPGLPNRTGYWLGLHLIRHLHRRYALREMASWSPATAQSLTRAALFDLAHPPPAPRPPRPSRAARASAASTASR